MDAVAVFQRGDFHEMAEAIIKKVAKRLGPNAGFNHGIFDTEPICEVKEYLRHPEARREIIYRDFSCFTATAGKHLQQECDSFLSRYRRLLS